MLRHTIRHRRGKRELKPLPTAEAAVPKYPGEPSPPTRTSGWLLLAPVAGVMLMSIGFGVLYQNLYYPLIIIPVSLVYPMVMKLRQRDSEKRWLVERDRVRDAYQNRVNQVQQQLERQRAQQTESLNWTFPDPRQLATWAQTGSERLWERRPDDPDFMQLRVGSGAVSASFPILVPKVELPELEPELLLEAVQAAGGFRELGGAPMSFDFVQQGSLGISGPRHLREASVRAILTSAAALHAPDDLAIYAVLPSTGISEWEWLKWLPHTRAVRDPSAPPHLGYEPNQNAQLLSRILDELEARGLRESKRSLQDEPFVLLLVADHAAVTGEAAVDRLITEGPATRAGILYLTPSPRDLPHGCRGRLEIRNESQAAFFPTDQSAPSEIQPDLLDVNLALTLARGLAPIQLVDSQASGELPDQIRLLELIGTSALDRVDFQARWLRALREAPTLRVPIGMRHGDRPLEIDLRQSGHGPHGLIAGTTGSGKSELLLTLLTSLAYANHPHQVNFVLVDYKGGTAMTVLNDLPHTVGVVTDLDGKQTRRALVALRSELTRREGILALNQVADIDKYHELGISEPFPYLFIVIDEFAELRERFQDDLGQVLNEFVSIAQKGRALGVHLILAMQRPEGVVNDKIRANMRFRICLRVERSQESRSVLGRPDAYLLPSQPPGRAYFQVGNDEQFDLFQVARVAGLYHRETESSADQPLTIREVAPDGRRIDLFEIVGAGNGAAEDERQRRTEAQLLVERARRAAEELGIEKLQPPWPPPLPSQLALDDLIARAGTPGWDGTGWPELDGGRLSMQAVPIGLIDDPKNQRQVPYSIDLEHSGNLLVVGSPGSGRTTSLLTLVTSLARAHRPDQLHFHLIDFAGHQLRAGLDSFPHVAGTYGTQDRDRIRRLLTNLAKDLERRQGLFASAGAVRLSGYWRRSDGEERLPAILTVINNFSGFREAFLDDIGGWIRLLREGGAYGMFFAITSDRFPPGPVADLIQTRIALRFADRMMYTLILGGRPDLQTYDPVAGRGFVNSNPVLEVQVAMPSSGSGGAQIGQLQELATQMGQSWRGTLPAPVRVLSDQVALATALNQARAPGDDTITAIIGLDGARLEPAEINLARIGSYLLVTGPPQSGKSTALATLALSLASRYGPNSVELMLITPNRSERYRLDELARLPHARGQAKTERTVIGLLEQVEAMADQRTTTDEAGQSAMSHLVLMVDDYHLLMGRVSPEVMKRLETVARKGPDIKLTTVLTVPTTLLATVSDPLLRQAIAWRNGIWLQSTDTLESNRVGVRIPNELRGRELPVGRGYVYDPGSQSMVQLASPELQSESDPSAPASLEAWVARLRG